MQRRLFGLETEYALVTDEENDWLIVQELLAYFQRLPLEFSSSNAHNYIEECWLENGSRVYRDQWHPEYATPECESVYDLVCQEKAGDILFKTVFDKYCKDHPAARKNTWFLKSNLAETKVENYVLAHGSEEASWGSHENILATKKAKSSIIEENLPPMLASRQIWSGAGHIQPSLKRFVTSGRPYHLTEVGNLVDGGHAKQAFFVRAHSETSDINHKRFWRIQISSSESNMLEFPVWLRFMTTHFCLRLAEEGLGISRSKALRYGSIDFFKRVSEDTFNAGMPFRAGRDRALEIQHYYLARAKRLSPLNGEERKALADWEWILGLLDCDLLRDENLFRLFGVLDWATKLWLMKQVMRKHNLPFNSEKIKAMNVSYHALGGTPEGSLWLALQEKDKIAPFIKRVVNPADVAAAMKKAPDSRARLRSEFIKLINRIRRESPELKIEISGMDWGSAWFFCRKSGKKGCIYFGISNPFLKISKSLENFRRKYADGK